MSHVSRAQTTALTTLLPASPIIADLGRLFAEAGHQLYLVGGSVRDALLGQLGNDLDFTTSARPDESQRLLRQFTAVRKRINPTAIPPCCQWDKGYTCRIPAFR